MSANRAAIYYSASGAWLPITARPSPHSPPYCDEGWTVESVQAPFTPLSHWYPTQADVENQKAILDRFHHAKPSYNRFLPNGYAHVLAPSGFSVWDANAECRYRDPSGVLYKSCCAADAGSATNTTIRFFSLEAAR
jgi:hypothetical protein